MKQFAFETLYSLIGLAFLLVTFLTIGDLNGNDKKTNEIKPLNSISKTAKNSL